MEKRSTRPGKSSLSSTHLDSSSLMDPEDLLGKTLQNLLSRGNAILAEILRLSDHSPFPNGFDSSSYPFLFSFEDYFKDPERNEMTLNLSAALVQQDEEFQTKHLEFLERFYHVCAGIVRLGVDSNQTTRELRKGYFLSHTVEQALLDSDGKQWIPECLHLLGCSLLVLNEKFIGMVRERFIVAYYRIKGEASLVDFDQVVALVSDLQVSTKGIYLNCSTSELLLSRFHVDGRLARAIASRIQSDDVYGHSRAWPLAEHRSTALANQASLLYIALLFAEAGLKNKNSEILPLSNGRGEMREIVDKHFSDQWIVVVCSGFYVDLDVEWAPYPAAKTAITDVVSRVHSLKMFNKNHTKKIQTILDEYLTRGVLTERYVMDHWESLLEILRDANAALRWRLLHSKSKAWNSISSTTTKEKEKDSALTPAETIKLLLSTAQLEHVFKEAIRRLLDTKDETWKTCRERVAERMKELSQYFSGQVPLAKVQKDEELMRWFLGLGEEISKLEYLKLPTAAGRRVQSLIKALEEVEKFEGVENSLQVREFLSDSRSLLEKMVRTVHIREEILVQIEVVSDLSYAWGGILDDFDTVWHDRVRQDPSSVTLFRAVFLKLSSVLDVALSRLAQAASPDVDSVAEYWSGKLVSYVKRVLEVVPQSVCAVFDLLGEILENIPEVSTRVLLNELGNLASGESRYELSKCTQKIAIFTSGIMNMGKCILGVVEVDPQIVLDEGLRRELQRRINKIVNSPATATSTGSNVPNDPREYWKLLLSKKSKELVRLRRSFEYVQDYLNLNGTQAWNEELSKFVQYGDNSYLNFITKQLVTQLDWTNEKSYDAILGDVFKLLGNAGFVRLDARLGLEQKSLTLEYAKVTNNCNNSLAQLNLPLGVVWGSANWVDSVREARRKYPSDQMESDLKKIYRIGICQIAREKIRFRLMKESHVDALTLVNCAENSKSNSISRLKTSLGATQPKSYVHPDVLDEPCARRTFILLNEMAKRLATDGVSYGIFGNFEYFCACAGIASFNHSKTFVQELNRCATCSARSLCWKSLVERQNAEASVFKFGSQKVSKLALERLLQEQGIHRVIAQLAGRDQCTSENVTFIRHVAEQW